MWILVPTANARTQRQQMAQMRSADRLGKCLLFGVDRTYCGRHEPDAFDPQRTWRSRLLDHLVSAGEDRRRDREAEPPLGTRDQMDTDRFSYPHPIFLTV